MSDPRLEITTRRDGASVALVLSGELDVSVADGLNAAILGAEMTDTRSIVVDLSDVVFVDSTGLSVLLAAKKRSDGRLTVSPSNHDAVTRLLELTGTTEMLDS